MRTIALLSVCALILISLASVPVGWASTSAPFTVVGAIWGTAAKPIEAAPGGTNVPLTVTVEYQGSLEAQSVRGLLQLSAATVDQQPAPGFTDTYGNTTATNSVFSISSDSAFALTYFVNLANTTKIGAYSIPIELEWTDSTTGSSGYNAQSATISVTMLGIPDLVYRASPLALIPGRVNNVSLTVTNEGSGAASQVAISDSASGVSVLNPVFEIPSLAPGQSRSLGVGMYVPATLSGSSITMTVATTYYDAYGSTQSTSQTIGLYANRASAPILNFEALTSSIAAGETSTVPLILTNLGSGTASDIHIQITSSGQSSVLNQFPIVGSLGPNSSTTADIGIYVPQSLAGSPVSLTITSSYTDEFGNAGTSAQSLGLYVANTTTSLPSTLISVTPVRSTVRVGAQSTVSFTVVNAGPTPLTSPVLSLTVSSPLVVTQNSTYAIRGGALRSGESVVYEAVVGTGTSSTPGFYSASVAVTYLDSSGTLKSAIFSSGLVLSGTINLALQSPTITQANTTVVVTGSILNEGFSSAYYASVTGSIAGSKGISQADYVGEVDPNTPIPFSVTMNYVPQAAPNLKANITITVSYTDSLGLTGKYMISLPTTLKSAGQLLQSQGSSSSSSSSGSDSLTYLEYGVVAALVVVAVVGAVYIRRNRAVTIDGEETRNHKADHEVI
ncbi:MAG TPA: CARDB domain-containing protein [Nitrososphaerales archaeon]|nr:CARDB domain-containing protein [Nitrososphaerales archaeon]